MVRVVLKQGVMAMVIALALMFGSFVVTGEASAPHKTGQIPSSQ